MLSLYQTWSEESLMQVKENDDLLIFMEANRGQM